MREHQDESGRAVGQAGQEPGPHVPTVLVAYASKNRGTAQMAHWIGDTIAAEGLGAEVRAAAAVTDVHGYDAVVLGSGLHEGRWLRDAVRFARRNRRELLRMPVWLFSSGPLDDSASTHEVPPVPEATRVADRVDARANTTFGGRLREGTRGFLARMLVRSGRAGDFRDREQVRTWALAIAHEVAARSAG